MAIALIVAVGVASSSCDSGGNVRLTTAPGVSIPNPDELAAKLYGASRGPGGFKLYVEDRGRLIEVKPPDPPKLDPAVVRSFDSRTGVAYIDIGDYSQYKMPLIQVWRFDGKSWSDSIDPGILVR